jgi:hypothetical protein
MPIVVGMSITDFEAAIAAGTKHTRALKSSRWERFYFAIFRRQPASVVERRMLALHLDEMEMQRILAKQRRNA